MLKAVAASKGGEEKPPQPEAGLAHIGLAKMLNGSGNSVVSRFIGAVAAAHNHRPKVSLD